MYVKPCKPCETSAFVETFDSKCACIFISEKKQPPKRKAGDGGAGAAEKTPKIVKKGMYFMYTY